MAHNAGAGTAHSSPPYYQPAPPYGNAPLSPLAPYPPQKQQRLSPNNAVSPYSSPQLTNGTIPNTNFYAASTDSSQTAPSYHAPYLNGSAHATSPTAQPGSSNMAPPSTPGVMGPPSKPVEDKPVDVNDLGDVLAGSGVDIREEEANLLGMPRKQGQSNHLLGSGMNVPTMGDPSSNFLDHPTRGFSVYSQNIPGPRSSFYGAGTFNQPALTEEQLQQQLAEKQRLLVRRRAEMSSHHMYNSFLDPAKLSWRIKQKADAHGVLMPDFQPAAGRSANNTRTLVMPNTAGDTLAVTQGAAAISIPADILTHLSLACKDHLRTILEHAVWMAKSRKETSTGIVPPEFKDIAIGQGEAEEIEIDDPSSAKFGKRSFADSSVRQSSDDQPTPKRVKTIKFSNPTAELLAGLAEREAEWERIRIEKRAARRLALLTGDGSSSGAATPGASGAPGSTAGSLADKKMTKKELKKATEVKQSEAEIAKASNSAAEMALGGGGGPSWLKGMGGGSKAKGWLKSKQPSVSSFNTPPSRTNSSSQVPKVPTSTAPVSDNRPLKSGEKREDTAGYGDLQMSDLISAMETYGKEKMALARAYNRQD